MDEQQEQQQIKKRRGCLFYGCLMGCFMLLLILLGGLLGYRQLKKMSTDFTDDKPVALPAVNMSQAQMDQVRKRVDDFRSAVRGGTQTTPLELTSDEVNALIETDPDLQAIKGKLYVTMNGDKIDGQICLSMSDAGLQVFKDRYLNGKGTFNLVMKNGLVRLTAQDITVKGKPVPEVYMQKIRTLNLAKNVNNEPRVSVAMDWIDSVHVKDSKLIITPKATPPR